jgi:hypothetical protein
MLSDELRTFLLRDIAAIERERDATDLAADA